jgi:hypothetical protein
MGGRETADGFPIAVTPSCPNPTSLASILDQVRVTGAEHVILSSDFGQVAKGDQPSAISCR